MRQAVPIAWKDGATAHSATIFVEGDKVVGMSPVQTDRPGIIVPTNGDVKKYLGDYVANGLRRIGVRRCPKLLPGCPKRQAAFNALDRGIRRIFTA